MSTITDQALARKQRFLQVKQEVGGAAGISDYFKNISNKVWFTEQGDIMSISKEHNADMTAQYKVAEFTDEQIAILKDKNWNLYRIEQDRTCEGVFYLSVKPQEAVHMNQEFEFLTLVPEPDDDSYDIKIRLKGKVFTVWLSEPIKKLYTNIPIESAVKNGKKQLIFYITTLDDPSFLLETVVIRLCDLLENDKVTTKLGHKWADVSVYTVKVFNKYVRE
jgi:hypothetical protein